MLETNKKYKHIFILLIFAWLLTSSNIAKADDFEKYYLVKDLDDDKIIVEDKWGDKYLVEYGIGCSSMWVYEGKYIYIDKGTYLDGIGDRIYLVDRDQDCKVWDAEELDSSGGSYYSGTYSPPTPYIPPQPSCPANASYSNGGCTCNSGYATNTNKDNCITIDQYCQDKYGVATYGIDKSCYCTQGYEWNSSQTACIASIVCPANSVKVGDSCVCNEGYLMRNGQCITHTEDCRLIYGNNVIGEKGVSQNSSCNCTNGYVWNSTQTACEKFEVQPVQLPSQPSVIPTKPTIEATAQQKEQKREEITPKKHDTMTATISGIDILATSSVKTEEIKQEETKPKLGILDKIKRFLTKLKFW